MICFVFSLSKALSIGGHFLADGEILMPRYKFLFRALGSHLSVSPLSCLPTAVFTSFLTFRFSI